MVRRGEAADGAKVPAMLRPYGDVIARAEMTAHLSRYTHTPSLRRLYRGTLAEQAAWRLAVAALTDAALDPVGCGLAAAEQV